MPSEHPSTAAGIAIYSPWVLAYIYDTLVLRIYNTFVWRCPTLTTLLPFFRRHTSAPGLHLLDIGVGTGFYHAHATYAPDTKVTLLDLNQDCLASAKRRLEGNPAARGVACRVDCRDVLAAEGMRAVRRDAPWEGYDVVSLMYLLHCLPGPVARKAELVSDLKGLAKRDTGRLVGATILGKGVRHNLLGRFVMWWHNGVGIFDNRGDDVESLVAGLEEGFGEVEWRVEGVVLIFEARGPKV